MRSYTHLQENGIIYNKRGIGYFVATDAKNILIKMMKQKFIEIELPEFFRKMELIGLTIKDLEKLFVEQKTELNNLKSKSNEKN